VRPVSDFVRLHFLRRSVALRRVLFGAIFFGSVVLCPSGIAQQSRPEEYQLKAVYLFNFGRFVEWPATPASPPQDSFDICVLGRDPFGSVLDATLMGESVNNQRLAARRISNSHDAVSCRILFISSSEAARIRDILASLEKSAVLTVSDLPGFTSNGGMIQFVMRENKIHFEVNLTAADKAGLTLSSQLLKVATDIRKESPSENVKP
jgi:hypothetical protein